MLKLYRNKKGISRGNCTVCERHSATRYLLSIGKIKEKICPICKGILTHDIERINKQYEGY